MKFGVDKSGALCYNISRRLTWWDWRSWLARQVVALKAVGSNPISHPKQKIRIRKNAVFLFVLFIFHYSSFIIHFLRGFFNEE